MLRQQSNLLDVHTVGLVAVTFGAAHLANVFFPTWQQPLPQSLLSLPTNAWFNGVTSIFYLSWFVMMNATCFGFGFFTLQYCHIVCVVGWLSCAKRGKD